jgi:hypothetical protein
MHSVLNTFFQTPVSGEEKKKRLRERVAGLFLPPAILFALELTSTKNGQPNAQRKKIRLSTSSQ